MPFKYLLFTNKKQLLFILFLVITYSAYAQKEVDRTKLVNPFVGTSGDHGQLTPSATIPFGLVKLGAETEHDNQAGYDYTSSRVKGFTINRMEGVGCLGAGGNILVLPGKGDTSQAPVRYDKSSEFALPGYYKVNMPESNVMARLTATNTTGWEEFTFNAAGKAWIMINLGYSLDKLIEEKHLIIGNSITGDIAANSVCKLGTYRFYYHLQISKTADSIVKKGSVVWYFINVTKGERINVWTSVSSVSPEQALATRNNDIGHASFESIRQSAATVWRAKLDKIQVEGKEEYVKLFYTHYYHTLLSPSKLNESSGSYRGSDGKVYSGKGFDYYHGWSLWDNFRTEMPLLTLTEPSIMNDICRSLVELYRQGKAPWGTATEPFPTVRTEHAIITLLDCYRKGINKFDLLGVYPLLKKEAEQYPYKTPDQQLETAYDYWALSQIAGILHQEKDAILFTNQALKYKNIWDQKFKVMNDKSDVMHGDGLYEGTLWQYRWFVPYDVKGMINQLGNTHQFTNELEYFFNHHLYNHANEPDIAVPYLFNMTNKPYLTQAKVNEILTKEMQQWYATHTKWTTPYIGRIYRLDPVGYIPEMDDDAGTMSAWYVLSSMGLYPLCVGEPVYSLTSPILSKATIKLPGNKTFVISTRNFSDSNFYIQKASLNGKPLNRCWITQQQIMHGGNLTYTLGNKPNKVWGLERPYITKITQKQ